VSVMNFGGLHAYHMSRKLERLDMPFAALIFAAIRKADSDNLASLEMAFPELVREMRERYNAPAGVIAEDQIEAVNEELVDQINKLMERELTC
jgi:hypothetical protein